MQHRPLHGDHARKTQMTAGLRLSSVIGILLLLRGSPHCASARPVPHRLHSQFVQPGRKKLVHLYPFVAVASQVHLTLPPS